MNYSKWITSGSTPIFLFHGVIPEHRHTVRNYNRKHISQDHFYKTLRSFLEVGTPLSMDSCLPSHETKGFQPANKNGFIVTFDDGFKNNLEIAVPILEELKIPALFYITTNFIEKNSDSWIDLIESVFEEVQIVKLKTPFIQLNTQARTDGEKKTLLDLIRHQVKNDATLDPYEFADHLMRQLGFTNAPKDRHLDEKLNWLDVTKLATNPLFKIGGHGHTHRILSFLDDSSLTNEIDTSLSLMKDKAGVVTQHYCYPDGQANCYSEKVITKLVEKGIRCAPTAIEGGNSIGDSLFHLKRVMVT